MIPHNFLMLAYYFWKRSTLQLLEYSFIIQLQDTDKSYKQGFDFRTQ